MRLGVLMGIAKSDPEGQARISAFRHAFRDLTWIEGSNVHVDYRWATGDASRTQAYAAELVSLAPDVILATNTPTVRSLHQLTKTIPIAEGAHYVAFTKDWRYGFVQNALLNLPEMSDGSITVVDLKTEKVIGSIDTLKNKGLNPNSIVLLPQWNHLAGH